MIHSCTDDDVYMEDASRRREYVLNESGMMWVGSHNNMSILDWEYDQVLHMCSTQHLHVQKVAFDHSLV